MRLFFSTNNIIYYSLLNIIKIFIIFKSFFILLKIKGESKKIIRTQENVLLDILRRQKNTTFGKSHNFHNIKSISEYQKSIKINNYEDFRPLIIEQERTGNKIINSEQPFFYAISSGTSGEIKFIPFTQLTVKNMKLAGLLFMYSVLKKAPNILKGQFLHISGPMFEKTTHTGIPAGSISGFLRNSVTKLIKYKYIIPEEVLEIHDYELKYLVIARLALNCDNISYIFSIHPNTLLRIISIINTYFFQFLTDIRDGTFFKMNELDGTVSAILKKTLAPDPKKYFQLKEFLLKNKEVKYKDIWPNIQIVMTWKESGAKIFMNRLEAQFSEKTILSEAGYATSEFIGSIPLFSHSSACLPTFFSIFFEFIEQKKWEQGIHEVLGLNELEYKKKYYIFATTNNGLYRYNINDVIEVDGFYNQVPLIKFVRKGQGVTNITGEKISENQAIEAMLIVQKKLHIKLISFIFLAAEEKSQYFIYIEPFSDDLSFFLQNTMSIENLIQETLCDLNMDYKTRSEGSLILPASVYILKPGTFEIYKKFLVSSGQRESQLKVAHLQYADKMDFDFNTYIVDPIQKSPSE